MSETIYRPLGVSITGNTAGTAAMVSKGTVFLAGGSNITLSQNGSSISIVGGAGGTGAGVVNWSAGTLSSTGTAVTFADSNGVSWGLNSNGVITASITPAGGAQTAISGIVASDATYTSGTVTFTGVGGGVTVKSNTGQRIDISVAAPVAQTNQTVGFYAAGNTTQNSSTTLDARTISVDGLGGITVGYSNGSLQISGPQTVAQTNQSIGYYAVGNTTQNSSTTLDARTVSLNGLGGITVGYSNGSIDISGPQTVAQTNQTVGLYAVGNTTQNSSTTLDARTISVDGIGGITVGYSNGSLQISGPQTAAQTNQTIGYYAVGNTTQNSSTTLDARTVSFDAIGSITVGYSNGSIQLSAPNALTTAALSQDSSKYVQNWKLTGNTAGTTSSAEGSDLWFSGGANITLSGSSNTIVVSAGAGGQSNQTIGFYGVGNTTENSSTTLDARTISFNAHGSITVGYSNGSIELSAPNAITTALGAGLAASGITSGTSGLVTGALSFVPHGIGWMSQSVNGGNATLTIGGYPAIVTNTGNTAGNTGAWLGGGYIAGSNAVTLSVSTVTAALNSITRTDETIWVQVPIQTNQTLGLYAVSNTEGASSSSTFDARTLSFQGKGAASVGFSNGSVIIDAPNAGAGNVTFSAGASSAGLGSVVFSNSNGVSFGLSGSTMTASVAPGGATGSLYFTGNTTQNSSTTQDYSSVLYNGLGAITVGYSNGSIDVSAPVTSSLVGTSGISVSTNGSTISVYLPGVNYFEPIPLIGGISSSWAPTSSSWYFQPIWVEAPLSGGRWDIGVIHAGTASMIRDTTAASYASNTTGTGSTNYTYARNLALYSVGAGTNSTRLESVWSSQFSLSIGMSVQVATGGATTVSVSHGATMTGIKSIDSLGGVTTTTYGGSGSSSSAAASMATTAISSVYSSLQNMLTSQLYLPIAFNTTINPGQYYLAHMWITNSTTAITGGVVSLAMFSVSNQMAVASHGSTAEAQREWLQTASSSGWPGGQHGLGVYSAGSGTAPATVAFSDLRSYASMFVNYVRYVNSVVS